MGSRGRASAHPRIGPGGSFVAWSATEIAEKAVDPVWSETIHTHLRSLSWFMKCVKERLARRANRDDGCTGHVWGEHGRMPRVA